MRVYFQFTRSSILKNVFATIMSNQ